MVERIKSILTDSSLDESFIELVLNRLESLTYVLQDGEEFAVAFAIQKVENHIKNACNVNSIPEGLKFVAVDMICGHFLYDKNQIGKLGESFDVDAAVKQISEGDTSVTFAINDSANPAEKLNKLLEHLRTHGEGDFVCYRKLKW